MIYKNDGEKKRLGSILSMGCPLDGQIEDYNEFYMGIIGHEKI